MNDLRIIITGHTGFIGKHLLEYFKKKADIIGISRSSCENDAVESIRLDISKTNEGELESYRPLLKGADAVVHLSAYRPIVRSRRRDFFIDNIKVNVGGTLNALMIAKRFKIDKFLLASSIKVYGDVKSFVSEEDPPLPNTNYGKSKLLAEKLCETFSKLYGIKCISLRISSVFGPGMSCNLVFSIFMNKALWDEPLIVHRYQTGYELLDLIYVKDVIRAVEKALYLKKENPYEVFNIGSQSPVNTFELANEVIAVIGSNSRIEVIEKKGRRRCVKLSIEKARKYLKWKPNYDIKTAIRDFLAGWYCEDIACS